MLESLITSKTRIKLLMKFFINSDTTAYLRNLANISHPYFGDIHRLLLKYVGIDQIVDDLVKNIGHLEKAFFTNDFAQGKPGNVIDLVLVGNNFDDVYLNQLVKKTESSVSFKIRYITVAPDKWE